MAENIHVNQEKVQEDVQCLEGAAAYLKNIPLSSQDTRTTLPANVNGRLAYERAERDLAGLGASLDQEVNNIRGLNIAFAEFDEMLGELSKGGYAL